MIMSKTKHKTGEVIGLSYHKDVTGKHPDACVKYLSSDAFYCNFLITTVFILGIDAMILFIL